MTDFAELWDRAHAIGATDLYTLRDGRVRVQIFIWSDGLFRGSSSAVAHSPVEALEAAIAGVDAPDPSSSWCKPGEPQPAFPYGFTQEAGRADR